MQLEHGVSPKLVVTILSVLYSGLNRDFFLFCYFNKFYYAMESFVWETRGQDTPACRTWFESNARVIWRRGLREKRIRPRRFSVSEKHHVNFRPTQKRMHVEMNRPPVVRSSNTLYVFCGRINRIYFATRATTTTTSLQKPHASVYLIIKRLIICTT